MNSPDTQHTRKRGKLASAADSYRAFFEEAVDGMFITDQHWRFLAANRQWLAITGYSLEDLLATHCTAMIDPEDFLRQPPLGVLVQQDRIATREQCFLHKNGSRLQVEISQKILADGNILSVAHDITERKKAETAAKERTRELAALHALGMTVGSSLSLDQVGKAAMQGILTAVQPDLAYLFLRDGDKLLLQEVAPPEGRQRLGIIPEHRVGECICGLTVRENKALYSRNIHRDSRCTWDECKEAGIHSFASLPLRTGSEIIGVIGLASLTDRDFEAQAGFLEILAHQVSLALANARNYESAWRELAERKSAEERLLQETVFNQTVLDSLPGLFYLFDHKGRFRRWNTNFEKVSGYTPDELTTMSPEDFFEGQGREAIRTAVREVFQNGESRTEAVFLAKDRTATPYFFTGRRFFLEGQPCLTGMGIDITERKNAEAALGESEKKSRAIFERSPVGIILLDSQSVILDCNEHFAAIFEVPRERYLGIKLLDRLPDGPIRDNLLKTLAGEGIHRFEDSHTSIFSGKQVYLSIISERLTPDLLIVVITDITEQKQAALAQEKLQEQLLQAQKMESVGRLAGGVAHDFNNMLTAILGHAELAMTSCSPEDSIHANLKVIESAARRSADLVRQLLAFARKQTVAPKVLDLNDCVAGLLKMLVRLIGEDIDLVWKPDLEVWPIKIDPSQIDQILANLCVNARDAITGVGKITIGTKNITFDAEYCTLHPTSSPGEYVQLSVSDNGFGMDKEILEHIFEPFFTTKEVGKGTGLGLSTVYGIVKQNQGVVNVYSEPGKGTTFKIYLPRFAAPAGPAEVEKKAAIPRGSGQLVLLVEDEEVILGVGQAMLTRLGYQVLPAISPTEALRQAHVHAEEIELLITDVIMPEMNGRDLAQILVGIIPGLKCLFTSGYTSDIIALHGVLDEKIDFIQKPFSFMELAVKVNEVMKRNGD